MCNYGRQTVFTSMPGAEALQVAPQETYPERNADSVEEVCETVSDDVYRHLLKRVVLSTRARRARAQKATRPSFSIGSTSICEPRDGVVESVVIVHGRARTHAVAFRLEGLDSRWRATAINVL